MKDTTAPWIALPREDEIESLESHVRWLKNKHGWDDDASPIVFIRRAIYAFSIVTGRQPSDCHCDLGAVDDCPYHDPQLAKADFGSLDSSVRAATDCETPFCTNWNPCDPCARVIHNAKTEVTP